MRPEWLVALGLALTNLAAFLAFGLDKARARREARRIPESRLLLLASLLAFPGAWIGVRTFRHKTRKGSFLAKLALVTLVDLGLVALLWRLRR